MTTINPAVAWRATPAGYGLRLISGYQRWRHVRLVSQEMVRAFQTPGSRTIITLPNQTGKTTSTYLAGGTWALDHWPMMRLGLVTYGQAYSAWWSEQLRNLIVDNPEYLRVRVAGGRHSKMADWATTEGGGMLAVGIGGAIQGRPLDGLWVDDPIKNRREAESQVVRDSVWNHWLTTLRLRLQPQAPVVVTATRLHEDDFVGRLTNPEVNPDASSWRVLRLPQIAEHPEERERLGENPQDPLGREPGEVLEPRRFSPEEVAKLQRELGSYYFAALQQGRPAPAAGTIFRRGWWRYYDRRPHTFDEVIQSWDMSFKETDDSDYVVGTVWGRIGGDFYLLDLVRDRMEFTEAVEAVRNLTAKWPEAVAKLVEDAANGPAVISVLQAAIPGLIPYPPRGSKIARARAGAPVIQSGNVYLPRPADAGWVDAYVDEHANFPNGANDDQVDSTSQALDWLTGTWGGGWTSDYKPDGAARR